MVPNRSLPKAESPATTRSAIDAVRGAVIDLHKELVAIERVEYERLHGRIESPGDLLELVAFSPRFAWLRTLSGWLVDFDTVMEDATFAPLDGAAVRRATESLLFRTPSEFRERFLATLQTSPEVVMAQAKVSRALDALPSGELVS